MSRRAHHETAPHFRFASQPLPLQLQAAAQGSASVKLKKRRVHSLSSSACHRWSQRHLMTYRRLERGFILQGQRIRVLPLSSTLKVAYRKLKRARKRTFQVLLSSTLFLVLGGPGLYGQATERGPYCVGACVLRSGFACAVGLSEAHAENRRLLRVG